MDRIIRHIDYLVDVQTADFGEVNACFVRADMTLIKPAVMARLLHPDIILHDPAEDGTLRNAATKAGIHAITAVAGGPQLFQQDVILLARDGLLNLLIHLDMQEGEVNASGERRANWMYTMQAGVLEAFPEVGDKVKRGQTVGRLTNVFGDVLSVYTAPENGIVLAKSVNPVCQAEGRILYLGMPRQ